MFVNVLFAHMFGQHVRGILLAMYFAHIEFLIADLILYPEPLDIHVSAIAASHSFPDVCHSKRVVSRMDLPQMVLPGWELETPSDFQQYDPRPGDIFMCAKQWWNDPVLAQRPMLVLPQALLDRLRAGGPEHALPRVTIRKRASTST